MSRSKPNRTGESEISIAALEVARDRPGGWISTRQLKRMIPQYVKLTPEDLEDSPTREGEQMWHQIVGNIVSHRTTTGNIIAEGFAEYVDNGLRITAAGLAHLKHLGR